ncbi:MAG: carboxymuconolactone decarboxylase family protein [Rhodoferax sp.]|nr:carboxymuconolactone decarboxylase family protein [Rhodoferax sp.]
MHPIVTPPAPRLEPLPPSPELADVFAGYQNLIGFIPNSVLIMQRRPRMARALQQLGAAVWDPESSVPIGFKRLLALFASRVTGCQYCMAHNAGSLQRVGVAQAKVDALWDYRESPLFTEAERCALDFTMAASSVPNAVTDEMFAGMRTHWNDEQIVEIVGVIALFGFTNRWNDTMATPLESEPTEVAERVLSPHGWNNDKHARGLQAS